jgi:prepilin-type processing-associated H-X9-DG protein
MLMIFACLWGAWGAQPAAAPQPAGDKTTITFQGSPLHFVMTQANGRWKVDAAATLAGFPEGVRKLLEPAAAGPEGAPADEKAAQNTCLSHLKQLDLGAIMFASDHDQNWPDADKWTDEIMPYIKNEQILRCPAAPGLECAYALNRVMAGRNDADVALPAEIITFFESNLGHRNATGTLADVADPPRHNGGNNYAFADGHVKWSATVPPQPPMPPVDPAARAAKQQCADHLAQIMLATRLYAAQHGKLLPDADKWTDEIMPYLQDPTVLKCPEAPALDCAYAMNRALSGKPLSALTARPAPVLFFESTLGKRNASGTLADLPRPGRHQGGNNYAFGDGSVQWLVQPPESMIPPPTTPGAGGPAPPG